MLNSEKRDFIVAYTWIFGGTKKAAVEAYRAAKKSNNKPYIENIIACFKANATACFYVD